MTGKDIPVKLIFILLYILLITNPAYSLCTGYSWITELHAKRLGINCKSAQKQIDEIVASISQALISDRQVDIKGLGSFNSNKSKSSKSNKSHVIFKPDKELLAKIHPKP